MKCQFIILAGSFLNHTVLMMPCSSFFICMIASLEKQNSNPKNRKKNIYNVPYKIFQFVNMINLLIIFVYFYENDLTCSLCWACEFFHVSLTILPSVKTSPFSPWASLGKSKRPLISLAVNQRRRQSSEQ